MHLYKDDITLTPEVKCVVSRDSWTNLTSFYRQERLLPPSFLLSLPSASPQLCCLWHLSDTPGSSANSLYWHKTLLLFPWVHFLPVEWAEPAERGQCEVQGGTRTWGILPSDSSKLLKWLRHLAGPHPKGMTLLNRLIQIKSLLLQRQAPVIIWSHIKLNQLAEVAQNYLGWWLFLPG